MKLVFILLIALFSIVVNSKTNTPGELDGYLTQDYSIRSMSDWYDMRLIVVSTGNDTIKIDSLLGDGTKVKAVVNRTTSDGYVNVLTSKGTYYIKYPVSAGQSTPKLPAITRILKSGTVDTIIVFVQKVNQ